MEVRLSEQSQLALLGLRSSLQAKCQEMLSWVRRHDAKTVRQGAASGWRMHQLQASPFISLSLDMNYRLLCKLSGETCEVHRIVRHDLADAPRVNRNDATETPYVLGGKTNIEAQDLFAVLAAFGLSEESIDPLKGITSEQQLVDILDHLEADIQSLVLAIYETEGTVIPRSKHTIWSEDRSFESKLQASMAEWHIYLHPTQQYIVELPVDTRCAVAGSAGTGKTVCAWYRARDIALHGSSIGFVCATKQILRVSQQMLDNLLRSIEVDCYYLVPSSGRDLVQLAQAVDHVIIDEGQELPETWYSQLGQDIGTDSTGVSIFYDLNQLAGNISKGDTARFQRRLNTWNAGIQSIRRITNMQLPINYRNSREIAEFSSDVVAPFLPSHLQASIPLFSAGEVVTVTSRDDADFVARLTTIVTALLNDFNEDEIGIIVNGLTADKISVIKASLAKCSISVSTESVNNGRILLTSPRAIKGHERKAVVLCSPSIQHSTRKWGHAIDTYVSVTRARDRLVILQSP